MLCSDDEKKIVTEICWHDALRCLSAFSHRGHDLSAGADHQQPTSCKDDAFGLLATFVESASNRTLVEPSAAAMWTTHSQIVSRFCRGDHALGREFTTAVLVTHWLRSSCRRWRRCLAVSGKRKKRSEVPVACCDDVARETNTQRVLACAKELYSCDWGMQSALRFHTRPFVDANEVLQTVNAILATSNPQELVVILLLTVYAMALHQTTRPLVSSSPLRRAWDNNNGCVHDSCQQRISTCTDDGSGEGGSWSSRRDGSLPLLLCDVTVVAGDVPLQCDEDLPLAVLSCCDECDNGHQCGELSTELDFLVVLLFGVIFSEEAHERPCKSQSSLCTLLEVARCTHTAREYHEAEENRTSACWRTLLQRLRTACPVATITLPRDHTDLYQVISCLGKKYRADTHLLHVLLYMHILLLQEEEGEENVSQKLPLADCTSQSTLTAFFRMRKEVPATRDVKPCHKVSRDFF